MKKNLSLRYDKAAERTNEGWEQYSLPIGNGYCGASVFGGTDVERVQFTTNTFANKFAYGGVANFAELYLYFYPEKIEGYERGLRLTDGVAYSHYIADGVFVRREAFFSYSDKVFVYHVQTDRPLDFSVELEIPYLNTRSIEEGGREGEITAEENTLVMRGKLPARDLLFEGRLFVKCNGQVCVEDKKLHIRNATESVIFFVMDTSYKLCEEVFLDGGHKALGEDPHERLVAEMRNAVALGWEDLYARHKLDYAELMSRVELDLGGVDDGSTTDELLLAYRQGKKIQYLEEIYYAYGRHLLISSSRKNTPPPSLQGVWTVHDKSPWGSGFWHNINIQMNYWPAFTTNLAETFEAYVGFWQAYLKQAQRHADKWIRETNSENFVENECGWIIGTGAFCYEIEGRNPHQHSGPGTGGLTAKLFWDYYDFTRDESVLKDITYPAVHGAACFLTKTVRNYDGVYLCSFSASPEQILSGDVWIDQHKQQKYYHTVGCAFDQQMIYENACDDLACAALLGEKDETTAKEQEQLEKYSPVQIGYSGQIKEYGEERFYGEIGEAKHRHISQLVALMPGSTISSKTPAWLDSAEKTLELRGDESTGWALAHRFCAWARLGNGEHAYKLLNNLLQKRTYPNLWDVHPPFQIDGNFGAVAGMTEMLLQSHDGCIDLFPAIPNAWNDISFKGLKARGNFTVSCEWHNGKIENLEIESIVGGTLLLRVSQADNIKVINKRTGEKTNATCSNNVLEIPTEKGAIYLLTGFAKREKAVMAENFKAVWTETGVALSWNACAKFYSIYRAVGDDKDYDLLSVTDQTNFVDMEYSQNNKARLTYKIVAKRQAESKDKGAVIFLHPASKLEVERYIFRFKQTNLHTEY